MHNFKIQIPGALYVSTYGNDSSTTPTNPATPFRTINAALNRTPTVQNIVIGAGMYKETFIISSNRFFWGDGNVVISNEGLSEIVFNFNVTLFLSNIIFQNSRLNSISAALNLNDCHFKNCLLSPNISSTQNFTISANRSIFDNVFHATGQTSPSINLKGCVLRNSRFEGTSALSLIESTDADSTSMFRVASGSLTLLNAVTFYNNNWRGVIQVGTTLYRLRRDKNNNIISPIPSELDPEGLIGTNIYTQVGGLMNFNQDPLFSNLFDLLHVESASPNIGAANNQVTSNGNIGCVYNSNYLDTTTNILTTSNITSTNGIFQITNDTSIGVITTIPIQISTQIVTIKRIKWTSLWQYVRGAAATPDNSNVLLAIERAVGAGTNPERLTIEMRWSKQVAIPSADSHYDNNGYTTAGAWVLFEVQSVLPPRVDSAGRGDGDPAYNPTSSSRISARWVQLRITMRPGLRP